MMLTVGDVRRATVHIDAENAGKMVFVGVSVTTSVLFLPYTEV